MTPVTDLNLLRHARPARHPEPALRAAHPKAPRRRPSLARVRDLLLRLLPSRRRAV